MAQIEAWVHSQVGFHSIGIPSEWGSEAEIELSEGTGMFPFNWYPQRVGINELLWYAVEGSSKAYAFPFNWYPQRVGIDVVTGINITNYESFHSIGIPSEWGSYYVSYTLNEKGGFPFNWYPQRVGIEWLRQEEDLAFFREFPFNWYPQRVGISKDQARS